MKDTNSLMKKQRFATAALLFGLSALAWIVGAILSFVWHRQTMGIVFGSLSLMESSLAFVFYTLSRRAGNGAV